MRKILVIALLVLADVGSADAQLRDFPVAWNGWESRTEPKLAGHVNTVLTTEQRGDEVFGTWVETYDLSGRKLTYLYQNAGVEREHSGSMVRLGSKSVYIYDSGGRLEGVVEYTVEGLLSRDYKFRYDGSGRLVESRAFEGGKMSRQTLYIHSPEKREVEIKNTFYHEGRAVPAEKTVLKYNEKGQWVKRTTFKEDGSVDAIISYEYDAEGNPAKETHCCTYNYTHRYEYKYDRRGNWIERQDIYSQPGERGSEDTTPAWMSTYRVITYRDEEGNGARPK